MDFAPKGNVQPQGDGAIDPNILGQTAEDKDSAPVTTVKEYTFKPMERLPDVKGTSDYKPLQENTVRFALNVWAGWGPISLANDGFKPGKVWKTTKGDDFKVELVLIDNPVAMRDAYAAGEEPVIDGVGISYMLQGGADPSASDRWGVSTRRT